MVSEKWSPEGTKQLVFVVKFQLIGVTGNMHYSSFWCNLVPERPACLHREPGLQVRRMLGRDEETLASGVGLANRFGPTPRISRGNLFHHLAGFAFAFFLKAEDHLFF